eukprot:1501741-Pyramimonas_sp.AAC.1
MPSGTPTDHEIPPEHLAGITNTQAKESSTARGRKHINIKKKHEDGDNDISSSLRDAPPSGSGRRILASSKAKPGAALATGLEQIKRLLAQKGWGV